MSLDAIRNEISKIDSEIIALLGRRFQLIPKIVELKKQQKLAIFQPEREKQMQKKYWGLALENHLNPEMIRQVFELIVREMKNKQEELSNE
jgi:chorismate mutase